MPPVEVVIMPGVGHFLMMQDPERFNGLLRAVIDGFSRMNRRDSSVRERVQGDDREDGSGCQSRRRDD